MNDLSDTEIAWLSGLLEGEGSFIIQKASVSARRPRPSACVQVRMTDEDVVRRVAAMMGSNVVAEKPRRLSESHVPQPGFSMDSDRWSPSFITRAHGAKAERIMRLVRPHMGLRRGAKIDEILSAPAGTFSHQPRIKEATK